MSSARRISAVLAGVALLAGAYAASASADGDPASDYLLTQLVFAPYDASVPPGDAAQLTKLVQEARKAGYPVRVAMIGKPADLGAVPVLWRHPDRYAQFLSAELIFVYKGTLLVVMPNGFGVARAGKPLPAERRVLAAIDVPPAGFQNLPMAGADAVVRLAAHHGVHVSAPSATSGNENRDRLKIGVAAIALLLVVGIAAAIRRRRRGSRSTTTG